MDALFLPRLPSMQDALHKICRHVSEIRFSKIAKKQISSLIFKGHFNLKMWIVPEWAIHANGKPKTVQIPG